MLINGKRLGGAMTTIERDESVDAVTRALDLVTATVERGR